MNDSLCECDHKFSEHFKDDVLRPDGGGYCKAILHPPPERPEILQGCPCSYFREKFPSP